MHTRFNISAGLLALAFSLCQCGSSGNEAAAGKPHAATVPDGAGLFKKNCVICHGADGKLGLNGAKDLTVSALSLEERINIVTNGKNLMTPFGTILSPEEIKAVAAYTETLKK